MKTKQRKSHPCFMRPKKGNPVCRTCFSAVPKRAGLLDSHTTWHVSEGHRVKTEFGWLNEEKGNPTVNSVSVIRRYMRDRKGKMVRIVTEDKTVEGHVAFVGLNGIWLVDPNATSPAEENHIIDYSKVLGYNEAGVAI